MNGGGEPIRACMAPRRERTSLAAWKIVVPVIVVFFLLHCRMWYAEEEWLWRVLLADVGYQNITGNCALVLGAMGLGGWMFYARWRRPPAKGDKLWGWLLINFLHGCYWASGAMLLCTNVVVVFLFWLNSKFVSEVADHTYAVVRVDLHDCTPRSSPSRYSAARVLLNTFSYGEVIVSDSLGFRRLYLPLSEAKWLSSIAQCNLQAKLAEGWLGWGNIRHRFFAVRTEVESDTLTSVKRDYPSVKKNHLFTYTWRDIVIFACLRGIDWKDTTRVRIGRYWEGIDSIPMWRIYIRDSVGRSRIRVMSVHGQTGEVRADSLLSSSEEWSDITVKYEK